MNWPNDVLEPTVAYYRPLRTYYNVLVDSGFRIQRIIEPRPREEALEKYPETRWVFKPLNPEPLNP